MPGHGELRRVRRRLRGDVPLLEERSKETAAAVLLARFGGGGGPPLPGGDGHAASGDVRVLAPQQQLQHVPRRQRGRRHDSWAKLDEVFEFEFPASGVVLGEYASAQRA